jgi:hypothetical protein
MSYQTPENVLLENGRPMSECMPGNISGAVVKPATLTGRIIGQPRIKPVINIKNSDGSGTVSGLPISAVSGPLYEKIRDQVWLEVPGADIESVRERAALIFERVAASLKSTEQIPSSIASRPPPPADDEEDAIIESVKSAILRPEPNTESDSRHTALEDVDRAYSPLAALGMGSKKTKPVVHAESAPSLDPEVGPPSKLVYFEKEGVGTVPCFFHSVVTALEPAEDGSDNKTGFIVLIYDLRYPQNAARWFPPSFDPYGRPWAVKIKNDVHVYLVSTTGFQYVYDEREHCVLAVDRAVIGTDI